MRYLLAFAFMLMGAAPAEDRTQGWIAANQSRIFAEYRDLLAIPNVASDTPNIRRNADRLVAMLKARGLEARLLEGEDGKVPPAVFGEWRVAGAKRTLILYAHYDGQPVTPEDWKSTQPFEPTLYSARLDRGGVKMPMPQEGKPLDPDWRLYGRGASDDKAGVMAILAGVDAVRASGRKPAYNLKIFFEGEEEAGSPNLGAMLRRYKDLLASDGWVIFDGPAHPSGAKQIVLGVRGITGAQITIYGPKRPLHSGHYGNWALNPAMILSRLLASLKDENGRVTIDGFYDDVTPLTASERQAVAAIPAVEDTLRQDLLLGSTDGGGRPLAELVLEPSLSVLGLRSADVGAATRNVIPATATAAVDLRLVKGNDHRRQFDKLVAHIRSQGFHVTEGEPTEEERLRHPLVARVVKSGGYNATRTSLDHQLARDAIRWTKAAGAGEVLVVPSLGGSLPLYLIEETLGAPTVAIALANHDNNQHAEDENLRLGNLWDAIAIAASVISGR